MGSSVHFEDYSVQVKSELKNRAVMFLYEAGIEIEARAKRNTRVRTGKTKGSFQYVVDKDNLEVQIGSNYENAIWEEFGTGIYALNGDGRKKVPWKYQDEKGNWHKTKGKSPQRMLWNAFQSMQGTVQRMAERWFVDL